MFRLNNLEKEPSVRVEAPAEIIKQPKEAPVENKEEKERAEIERILEQGRELEMKAEQAVGENETLTKNFWEKLKDHKHLERKIHEHSPKIMGALHLALEMATHNPQVAHAVMEHLEVIEKQFGHVIIENVAKSVSGTAHKLGEVWNNYRQIKAKKIGLQTAEVSL